MPTVLKKDGFSIRIYLNDHLPAHVHVFKSGGEAKIDLIGEDNSPEWVSVIGMTEREAFKALEIVEAHQEELLNKWYEYHGHSENEQKEFKRKTSKSKGKGSR